MTKQYTVCFNFSGVLFTMGGVLGGASLLAILACVTPRLAAEYTLYKSLWHFLLGYPAGFPSASAFLGSVLFAAATVAACVSGLSYIWKCIVFKMCVFSGSGLVFI